MGSMYGWATPDYLLNHMTIEQIFLYYDYGIEFEEHKINLLLAKVNEALGGKKLPKRNQSQEPDKAAFKKAYGDQRKVTR